MSLSTVRDGTSFTTAVHLASYASPASTIKPSETSIGDERAPRGSNRLLKA
ncbi:hypothetical protein ACH4UV_37725 [Streptomyces sp. NPDC020802]|uniref:hypothetical protein n=1 Tax=Streptomyces sp. NPDC020802 TaxID=3365094 RepID=UPI0037AF028D